MRVAFSGTHQVGKTTLLEAVAEALPAYAVVDEPYRSLEEEGHELSDPPCVEDFERHLPGDLDPPTIEVRGTVEQRARQVRRAMNLG